MTHKNKGTVSFGIVCPCVIAVLCILGGMAWLFRSANVPENQHSTTDMILEQLAIKECSVEALGNYGDLACQLEVPSVEDNEIEAQISIILSEYDTADLSENFVQSNLGYASIDELKSVIKEKILESKKIALIVEARNSVLNTIMERSKFSLNQKEIAEYSLEVVNSYETEAALHNMTIEQYCTDILDIAYDQFFELCYAEGEHIVKTYLIIGAIAAAENISVNTPSRNDDLQALYSAYQEVENAVYGLFIFTEPTF